MAGSSDNHCIWFCVSRGTIAVRHWPGLWGSPYVIKQPGVRASNALSRDRAFFNPLLA